MSHTTKVDVKISSASAIRSAVLALQQAGVSCSLLENAKPRMFYSNQHGECEFVLKLNDCPYDVGFERQPDGTFSPVYDEWGGHIAKKIGNSNASGFGKHIGKFMQQYSAAVTIEAAVAQGYYVESTTTDAEGNIQLVLGGM